MATSWTLSRCREVIAESSRAGLAWDVFCGEAVPRLRAAIGFDCWCMGLCDPSNMLPAQAEADNPPVANEQRRFWQIEYQLPDVNKHAWLARHPRHAGILSTATRKDLARSPRWAQVLGPGGLGDELRASLSIDAATWGSLVLYRESRAGYFAAADAEFVADLVPALAAAARRAWRVMTRPRAGPATPGVIIATAAGQVTATTSTATAWLDQLGSGSRSQLHALTARIHADPRTGVTPAATLCARTPGGHWIELHADRLSSADRDVAITVQAARPQTATAILLRAYALSRRESEVTRLLLAGLSTAEIAAALHISGHTVHDHVKSIYRKTDTCSRNRLAARIAGGVYATS
jgi:DNA-binding CsgD family transcriptional regulator